MKTVYLLLTRSGTLLARVIHALTGDDFTHASLGVDPSLGEFYSFARLHARVPLPAGFVRETTGGGYFGRHGSMACALYAMDVPDEAFARIGRRLEEMRAADRAYRYSVMGLLLCRLALPLERKRRMFCSQFVARLLEQSGAMALPKPPSLMRPADFAHLPGLRLVYFGELRGAANCAARVEEGFA